MRWGRTGSLAPKPSGFEQLVLPHLDAAHNLASWLVRDHSLAQHLVQDAVFRALGYLASYRGGDVRVWLLRIVRTAAYDALALRKDGDPAALQGADPADDPEQAPDRAQRGGTL